MNNKHKNTHTIRDEIDANIHPASPSEKASVDCISHALEVAILLDCIHNSLMPSLAAVHDEGDTKTTRTLGADLVRVREHLKKAFRALTHIEAKDLNQLLIEASRDDEAVRDGINRLILKRPQPDDASNDS